MLNASLFQYVTDFKWFAIQNAPNLCIPCNLNRLKNLVSLSIQSTTNQNIQIQMHMDKNSKRTTLPLFGIEFALKEEFSNFAYFAKAKKIHTSIETTP